MGSLPAYCRPSLPTVPMAGKADKRKSLNQHRRMNISASSKSRRVRNRRLLLIWRRCGLCPTTGVRNRGLDLFLCSATNGVTPAPRACHGQPRKNDIFHRRAKALRSSRPRCGCLPAARCQQVATGQGVKIRQGLPPLRLRPIRSPALCTRR